MTLEYGVKYPSGVASQDLGPVLSATNSCIEKDHKGVLVLLTTVSNVCGVQTGVLIGEARMRTAAGGCRSWTKDQSTAPLRPCDNIAHLLGVNAPWPHHTGMSCISLAVVGGLTGAQLHVKHPEDALSLISMQSSDAIHRMLAHRDLGCCHLVCGQQQG
jgi:hypothetical protein